MLSTITSGTIYGMNSRLIQVEVDVSPGLPCFQLVGLPGSEVKESRERVKVALKNAGIKMPPMCINVNLSPANLPKNGTLLDLPVAVGILIAMEKLSQEGIKDTLLLGELGLSGELKPVRGVLPIVQKAAQKGIKRCLLPAQNSWEGALIPEIEIIGLHDIKEAIGYLQAREKGEAAGICGTQVDVEKILREEKRQKELDYAEISGQKSAKRAAEVAAAGFHHLLLMGPPGSGKTMIARRLPTILPPLSVEESLEVSSVYSIAGLLPAEMPLITHRPFWNPHHTITGRALVGSGRVPKPGMVSLAHRGVLFLDELPEFKRETLDILRQPLEDRQVQIARSSGTYTYPADFMLVGAMNPCPCGFYPDRERCRCSEREVRQYLGRVSGPIMDRMDICVEVQATAFRELAAPGREESSESIRKRVLRARDRQRQRFAGSSTKFNSAMGTTEIERYCALGETEQRYMEEMFQVMQLSARGYHKILRVARTIADLDDSDSIKEIHLAEAICYRQMDKKYW